MSSSELDEVAAALGHAARVRNVAPGMRLVEVVAPDRVPDEVVAKIFERLTPLAEQIFGSTSGEWAAVFDGMRTSGDFATRARFLLFADDAGSFVGWSSCRVLSVSGARGVYLDATALLPEYRRRRATTRAYLPVLAREMMRQPFRPLYVVGLASSPVVFDMELRAVGVRDVYPRPGERPPDEICNIAAETAAWLGSLLERTGAARDFEFDPDTFVVRGLWPPIGVESDASTGDARLDELIRRELHGTEALLGVTRTTLWDCARIGWTLAVRRVRGRPGAERRDHPA